MDDIHIVLNALTTARNDALEEAAKVADSYIGGEYEAQGRAAQEIADDIRALADKPAPAADTGQAVACYECGGPLKGPYCPECVPLDVQPLEWRGTDGIWAKADALFGATYRITKYDGMREPFKLETIGFVGPHGHYETADAAMKVAQEDYAARIRAALRQKEAGE